MQTINRIQIVTINTNANILGAMVVGGTNAHRAYLSLKPCDPSPAKKGSDLESSFSTSLFEHSHECWPVMSSRAAQIRAYAASGMWRLDRRYSPMPASVDVAPVFNRNVRD